MGLDPQDNVKAYWSVSKPHKYTPWFGQMMPRNRFEVIFHTFLHAGGVDEEEQEKIEPFLESLQTQFQTAFYPGREVSIDEMVISYNGRWRNKQFNSSKLSKYHIKTFGLCDSATGYIINVFTYYGKNTAYHPDSDPDSLQAVKVFQKLLEPLDRGHHIFADRFYTSFPLLEYLTSKSFYYTGTIDARRRNLPVQLKTLKLDHLQMKWYIYKDGKYLCVAFHDKKAKKNVFVVSSLSDSSTTPVETRRGLTVQKPTMITAYNNNMNGCDRADQNVGYYGMHKRKSIKWWKKIFHWLLELCHINARILFLLTRTEPPTRHSLVKFKDALISQLTEAAAALNAAPEPAPIMPALNTPQNAPVQVVARLAPESHFAETVRADRNCKVCSKPGNCKRTTNVCATCPGKPHLCRNVCFQTWHTRIKF